MRLRPALLLALLALVLPGSAHASGLYALSQKDTTVNKGITGLVSLTDGGGETLAADTGGFRITGTGIGPIVYSSGVIQQYNGAGGYTTLVGSAGSSITGMTVTGLGLLVADGDTLKLRSGSTLVPALPAGNASLPGGKLPAGDKWISITTLPDGHVLGWAFNNGYGTLYEINLSTGGVTSQDYSSSPGNDPLYNNRDASGQYYTAPVFNSGGISADGLGGVWLAGAGHAGPGQDSGSNQVYYAPPGSLSFSSVASGYTNPQITSTGTGEAYVTSTFRTSPFGTDVYKVTSSGGETDITSSLKDIYNSRVDSLAVDRCYTSCSVSLPGGGGGTGTSGTGNTGTTTSPRPPHSPARASASSSPAPWPAVSPSAASSCTGRPRAPPPRRPPSSPPPRRA
jgi:hypothetical protein